MRRPVAPQLSILMPVYNEAATVEQAVAAVLAADLPVTREIVLVDDGSTDGARQILEAADWPAGQGRGHYHEQKRGEGAAGQTALADARGGFPAHFCPPPVVRP